MNSTQIRCFLIAAQNLNFTESAAELFISQPAFSHNIATLEEEWGIELFVRDKKRKDTLLTTSRRHHVRWNEGFKRSVLIIFCKKHKAFIRGKPEPCASDLLELTASTRGHWSCLTAFRRNIPALTFCSAEAATVSWCNGYIIRPLTSLSLWRLM